MEARIKARDAVATTSRYSAEAGLLMGTAGNVSLLFDGPTGAEVAITATGAVLGEATSEHVSVISLDGEFLAGELQPTSEAELHLGLLKERGGAVVHTHSAIATAISLVVDELPSVHYQQLMLGGAIRVAPFAVFGSPELATSVQEAMAGKQAAILANHGTVAVGADLAAATENAELLEWAAELYWRARAIGTPKALTEDEQIAVIEAAVARNYGTTQKADS